MNVRAKFRVEKKIDNGETLEVSLQPVTATSEENSSFFKYTPYGGLHLGGVQPEVAAQFTVGEEVYLDITPASS